MSIFRRDTICCIICVIALALLGSSAAFAKNPPCVQFINIAPLPGAGIALDESGKPDGQGAMQLNIPIAYTPGNGYADLSFYFGQYAKNMGMDSFGNGSAVLGFGFGNWPRVYASAMAVSSEFASDSKVASGQIQVVKETKSTPAFAVGAQDILNKERKDFSLINNTGVSYYGVATKRFQLNDRKVYVSLGYGAGRFLDTVFGGASVPVNDCLTFATEYDGYQMNNTLAYRPGGRYSHLTVLAGYNGKAGVILGAHGVGQKISPWLAIPIGLLLIRR